MDLLIGGVALAGAGLWLALLVRPGGGWRTRERMEAGNPSANPDLSDVTAVVPARNEEGSIGRAVQSLTAQGDGLRIIVVDDGSEDKTAVAARRAGGEAVEVIRGEPLPPGWQGKLWALEQGRRRADTPYLLLMDADIELAPGLLGPLREKLRAGGLGLVSLMAELRMTGFWERLLLPAFVFFFKLLYPFSRANRAGSRVAAAAGGCVLLDQRVLERLGGFGAVKGAIIDDCSLAGRVKASGRPIWLGLTRSVRSNRAYDGLSGIWEMVARTAFTQLRYSCARLLLATALMVLALWVPLLALLAGPAWQARLAGGLGLGAMAAAYAPTLRFYGLPVVRTLTLPLAGSLFLAMTWASAWRYFRGVRSRWKGRTYSRVDGADGGSGAS